MMKRMDYFVKIVDYNSFTEAAQRCYISQSAISQQIISLERELGVQLLIRQNRSFVITPAGEYFYQQAREVLKEIEQIREETIRLGVEVYEPITESITIIQEKRLECKV